MSPASLPADRPRVLMMSSNGAGMGHLTRLLAYARHLPAALPGVEVSFLSLSTAAPMVRTLGYDTEYLPSTGATGMRSVEWRRFFAQRLHDVLERVRPDVVVFDGTHPYRGIDAAVEAFGDTRWIWSRRGMWKPGRNTDQLEKTDWFARVIEPGDLSAAADAGATAGVQDPRVHRVGPVTLVDRDDLLDPDEARRHLGLPVQGRLALVSLGAGNINDTSDAVGAVSAALRERGIGVCVTQPAIAERAVDATDVHVVRDFPISRCFGAFDLAFVAGGYNSFHESLRLGLPSAFVPNTDTNLDDQAARTGHAGASGWAVDLPEVTPAAAAVAVDRLLAEGPAMARTAAASDPGNGAADAAATIADVVQEVRRG
ncbi:UDP-N-acetylglucosamine--LPS N-acetylglucosamine transferase [Kytococcus schroeteri]|uniref:UDP-N-acetylglucosamine--LPS N-acetylglucosamine transferase n=1 Tax=Kytococcus schroeteri TaxID=138300 RepID=A0A2I1PCV1_9MICO|nr:UDP-N-acetylglucosamine--LPS N-acetylglucosamine transferase [Kytococcus schroeteri]PKZ42459.1 UDP-N-acetylglucosamine--LPS N-acetylglucosamine transferase [Kytococcus schroeteri]